MTKMLDLRRSEATSYSTVLLNCLSHRETLCLSGQASHLILLLVFLKWRLYHNWYYTSVLFPLITTHKATIISEGLSQEENTNKL